MRCSCLISGGKPTNGGSASWSRCSSDRPAPGRRRPVDRDSRPEVKTPISPSPVSPSLQWSVANGREFDFHPTGCVWSSTVGQREICGAFWKKVQFTQSSHQFLSLTRCDTVLKNIKGGDTALLFFSGYFYFIYFFVFLPSLGLENMLTSHQVPPETCLAAWLVLLLGFFFHPRLLSCNFNRTRLVEI